MKRTICVITGTRADYGIYFPILKAIESSKGLGLHLVATGMHLMKEFGYTVREIARDGFAVHDRIDASEAEDTGAGMARSAGKALIGFSKVFARSKADIILILGDRGEMLAASIAANYLNIPIAHIHGGEVSGHVDEIFRHAITKLSHMHFPATEKARQRILRLGEDPKYVFRCGAPALDRIVKEGLPDKKYISAKFGVRADRPFLLVVQHPVLTSSEESARHMKITLEAVAHFRIPAVVIYPNADAGGKKMIRVIRGYKRNGLMKVFKSIPHREYLALMKYSAGIIGNSSSAVIEAPSFRIPAVNIGSRQDGRERSSNIIDVGHSKAAIIHAIGTILYDRKFKAGLKRCVNPYGDGHASERIVNVLRSIPLDKRLLQKRILY